MTVTLSALYVLLGLGALLQRPVERGRLALAGLAAYAVAMASYSVILGSQNPQVIAGAARASGAAFFGVNTGLLLLGALLAAAGFALWRLHGLVAASGALRSAIAVVALFPIWWLLATIAGPAGPGVASLGDVPLRPRAEILLALPLALVAWSRLGLWPTHRLFHGGLLAPLGVALWFRVARPAMGDGLDHWQPLLMPLGVLGVWGGAMTGLSPAALNALAFVALASDAGVSLAAALLLMAAALALGASRAPATSAPARRLGERLAWAIAVLALPLLLEAGFRRQVTYTLAAAGGAAAAVWLGLGPGRDERDATATDAGAVAA